MSTSDERLTKLEVSVGVLDTKMDATNKKLDDVALLLQNQTTILGKFLLLEERHKNFEDELKLLKKKKKGGKGKGKTKQQDLKEDAREAKGMK